MIEVAPDMHNKFIIFGGEDVITGSFNITFDRWWANRQFGLLFGPAASAACSIIFLRACAGE